MHDELAVDDFRDLVARDGNQILVGCALFGGLGHREHVSSVSGARPALWQGTKGRCVAASFSRALVRGGRRV